MNEPEVIRRALRERKVWAVVGCSPDPSRDSHRVSRLLLREGIDMIPVNPSVDEVHGVKAYPSLDAIPAERGVEVVDIFRRADEAGGHVDEAIAIGAQVVWMQLGVIDHDAAERAADAGLDVVMDRCPAIELPALG